MENLNEFVDVMSAVKSVIIPIVSLVGGWVLLYIKKYVKRMMDTAEVTAELNYLQKMNEVKAQVMEEISNVVKSVVASNMDLAKMMKQESETGHLTDEQVVELNKKAMDLILASLPTSLTEEGGTLLNVIGDMDKLKTIIKNLIDQYVYEYKKTDNKDSCQTESTITELMEVKEAAIIPDNLASSEDISRVLAKLKEITSSLDETKNAILFINKMKS